jgi:diketogulonate reductase-like aldo/keto reductase
MSHEHGTSATLSAVQDSLKKSKLDYFDLVLLHDPMSGKKKRLEAYAVLNDLSQKGSIKSIGVSNYGVHHLKEIKEAGLPTPSMSIVFLSLSNTVLLLFHTSHQSDRAASLDPAEGDCFILQSGRDRRRSILPSSPRRPHGRQDSG